MEPEIDYIPFSPDCHDFLERSPSPTSADVLAAEQSVADAISSSFSFRRLQPRMADLVNQKIAGLVSGISAIPLNHRSSRES